jgi:hypothetical protein
MKRLTIAVFWFLRPAARRAVRPLVLDAGTTTTRFTATLLPAQETPPIANAESVGSGTDDGLQHHARRNRHVTAAQ